MNTCIVGLTANDIISSTDISYMRKKSIVMVMDINTDYILLGIDRIQPRSFRYKSALLK